MEKSQVKGLKKENKTVNLKSKYTSIIIYYFITGNQTKSFLICNFCIICNICIGRLTNVKTFV